MRIFKATPKADEENNKPLPDEGAMIPTGLERQANVARVPRPGAYPVSGSRNVASEDEESGSMSVYTSETSQEIPGTIQATLVPSGDGASSISFNTSSDVEQPNFDEVYEANMVEIEDDDSPPTTKNEPSTESGLQKMIKNPRFQCTMMAFLVVLAIATVIETVVAVVNRESSETNNGEIDAFSASAVIEGSMSNQTSSSDSEYYYDSGD